MPKRRKYTTEFKQQAVEMAQSTEQPMSRIAREIGLNPNILSRWCREMSHSGSKAFQGQGIPRDEEMAALKRELSRVKKERDFLKEAAAFFAKESK
jgi:transposase